MAGFTRVFTQFPGFSVLGAIESVNTIDLAPPANPLGAGVGVVCVVGEFEDGPLETPTRLTAATDLESNFGGLGYVIDGQPYTYPVAAQSAQAPDAWNGNAFVQMRNKRFAGLIVCRVDGSGGSVQLTRLACLEGSAAPWDVTPNGTVIASVNGGASVTGTFTAVQATKTGISGTYPTLFVGGETAVLEQDDPTNPAITITFTAADQSEAQVIARINSVAGATLATDSAGEVKLTSTRYGRKSRIGFTSGTALTTLGFPAAVTVDRWTATIVSNATPGAFTLRVVRTIEGVAETTDLSYTSGGGDSTADVRTALVTAATLAGLSGVAAGAGSTLTVDAPDNVVQVVTVQAEPAIGEMTVAHTTTGIPQLVWGSGVVDRSDQVTQAEAVAVLGVLTGLDADRGPTGNLRLCATTTPGTGTLEILATSTAAEDFGFTTGVEASAALVAEDMVIPAGTRIQDATNGTYWVTMISTPVATDDPGPHSLLVRPALDDDTCPTCAIAAATVIADTLAYGFSATNAAALTRLTGPQMDARYLSAIDRTLDVSGTAHDINVIVSARTTPTIAGALGANALSATAEGHRARKTVVAPPIGTTRATALGSTGIGVGAVGRLERVAYLFPGMTTYIPEIAERGLAGGTGFTADGVVQVRSDLWYASVRSVLPPEENAGQQLSDTNYGPMAVVALEDAYNRDKGGVGLGMSDYIAFKAAGIVAPRLDRSAGMVFQSDVTSVSPATQPALVDAKRRYLADYVIDTLGDIGAGYVKKLSTPERRAAFTSAIVSFLEGLKASSQPSFSRIADYSVKDDTTTTQRASGFQIYQIRVQSYPSMDYIVFRLTAGATVDVSQA